MNQNIEVREIQKKDLRGLSNYWFTRSEKDFLAMGADASKFPTRKQFDQMIRQQIDSPMKDKKSYALIWELDGKQIGHCNVNQLEYGKRAHMHLHLWSEQNRKKGIGSTLLQLSIPFFFENLKLKTLWCEPFSQNPAPNKTLPKAGFQFIKKYETIPGPINLLQEVCQYKMTKNKFTEHYLR